MSASKPPGYHLLTPAQLTAYYTHINLPLHHRHPPGNPIVQHPTSGPLFLSALIRHHASAIPFENLTLHYDRTHTVTLAHDTLYAKTITKRTETGAPCNRGGYCLENGGLLLCVLRTIGFNVYPTGGRMNKRYADPSARSEFESWGHIVNLVRIAGVTYLADVGMSLGMPASAVPLTAASAESLHNHGTFSMRLRKGRIQEQTTDQDLWLYEAKFNEKRDWLTIMCFSEVEFIADDFEWMNFYINGSRRYWMTRKIVVSKLLLGEDEEHSVVGLATLTDNVVKWSKGDARIMEVCKTEKERIAALEKYFEIRLTQEERRGIEGLPSALLGADLYGVY